MTQHGIFRYFSTNMLFVLRPEGVGVNSLPANTQSIFYAYEHNMKNKVQILEPSGASLLTLIIYNSM